ncbi:WD40 repeat-like protein [Epithele typhae]|uniref:WD40 repeat-like protein n=1 Tax=Epithele typhae TaxID=378194 RepID=UPI002008B1FA|nr:WD40 repeat-like protein [Epithele typhae]KAH9943034.1 WD40 repeat-like protein [Epithele typhae]
MQGGGDGEVAYNIYSKQLFLRGHGFPLWLPEPKEMGEVQLGDVGYMFSGGFFTLFNATMSKEVKQVNGIPDDYTPWEVRPTHVHRTNAMFVSHLCSRSVTAFGLEGSVASNATPIGAGLKFRCSNEQGAFIFVDAPPVRTQLHPSKRFARYLLTNIDKWYQFATSEHVDIDLKPQDLTFISGFIKTNDWGLGAFVYRGQSGEVSFQAQMPFITGSLSVSASSDRGPYAETRIKPRNENTSSAPPTPNLVADAAPAGPSSIGASPSTSSNPNGLSDQAIFLHYWRVKRRIWVYKQAWKAAAGPDEREPHDREGQDDLPVPSQPDDDYIAVQEPAIDPMYDPVGILLDYILTYPVEDGTEVDTAIACDQHVYQLFEGDVPDDLEAALAKMKPPILFVDDERQVATLAIAEWADELDDIDEEGFFDGVKRAGKQKDDSFAPGDPSDSKNEDTKEDEDQAQIRAVSMVQGAAAPPGVVLQEHTGGVTCVAWSPDGLLIASGAEDNEIILRDGNTGDPVATLSGHKEALWAVAFSPDSERLASGGQDGVTLLWDLATRMIVVVLEPKHLGAVQTLQYSSDNTRLLTTTIDSFPRIWDAARGTLLHALEGHTGIVMCATFSPDGALVGSAAADYTARLWDAPTGATLHVLRAHTGVIWSLAFAPDGARVATGSDDTTARVWDTSNGKELVIVGGHQGPVWAVAFAPVHGRQLLSASNDATVKICDSLDGHQVHAFDRHDTLVNAVKFSPDGRVVASSAGDNAVLAWATATGRALPSMNGHQDKVTGLAFAPGSDRLVSSSDDGSVRIWRLSEADITATAEQTDASVAVEEE